MFVFSVGCLFVSLFGVCCLMFFCSVFGVWCYVLFDVFCLVFGVCCYVLFGVLFMLCFVCVVCLVVCLFATSLFLCFFVSLSPFLCCLVINHRQLWPL